MESDEEDEVKEKPREKLTPEQRKQKQAQALRKDMTHGKPEMFVNFVE